MGTGRGICDGQGVLRWLPLAILLALPSCGREEHAPFDDPLHAHGIQLPPAELGLPPAAQPERPQVFAVPPPPFSPGIYPCSRCHVGGQPEPDTRPAIPHKKHLDRDLVCEDCHGKDPKVPAAKVCFDCHEDIEKEPEAVRAYFAATKQADGTYAFPRRVRTTDVKPNHPGHGKAGVACATCHGEASDAPFEKPKAVAWMAQCVACHTEKKQAVSCETCHKEIREPQHKSIVLHHGDGRHCLDCHNEADRDYLRLASGELVSFEKSYQLCGQCHGEKYRDWKEGLHGKRVGMWDGEKTYFLCVHCHRNPHAPHFPPMAPEPPPVRPEDIR